MGVCKRVRGRRVWCAGCAVALCCGVALGAVPAKAKTAAAQRRAVEVSPWEQADRGREALEAIPEGSRTKADYTKAMDGFRAVYHDAPQGKHAAAAVYAVAELLAEQGHGLHDAKSLKAAVGQYEFLRTQYPGSSLRVGALLAEAQIYQNDLHDAAAARERYSLLVKQYPRSGQAEEAKAGIASLSAGSREEGVGSRGHGAGAKASDSIGAPGASSAGSDVSKEKNREKTLVERSGGSSFAPMPTTGQGRGVKAASVDAANGGAGDAERSEASAPVDTELDASTAAAQDVSVQAATPLHVAK